MAEAYLALVAMNQNRMLRLILQDLDDFGNIVERIYTPCFLVRNDLDPEMVDAVGLDELDVFRRVGLFHKRTISASVSQFSPNRKPFNRSVDSHDSFQTQSLKMLQIRGMRKLTAVDAVGYHSKIANLSKLRSRRTGLLGGGGTFNVSKR